MSHKREPDFVRAQPFRALPLFDRQRKLNRLGRQRARLRGHGQRRRPGRSHNRIHRARSAASAASACTKQ